MNCSLIIHYRSTNTYALNVISGAIQSRFSGDEIRIRIAPHLHDVTQCVSQEQALGRRVLVAWSFYSTQWQNAARDFEIVRSSVSGVTHVLGGAHSSAEPHAMLNAGFDVVFIGESEHSILEFLERFAGNRPYTDIPGIAVVEDGRFRRNRPAKAVDLDEFPPFAPLIPRVNPIEITRGCIYACSFCQTPFLFKAKFRHRSADQVAHWARFMNERGIRDIRFITPTSLSYGSYDESVNLEAIENLLSTVRRELRPDARIFFGTFPSEVRPEHVSPAALALIRNYCDNDNILMGAQSGSDSMLNSMHRGHDAESVRKAVRYCMEAGLRPNVDFIFGLPGESEDDRVSTLALADELASLGARIHGHSFMPLPGTPWRDKTPGKVDDKTQTHLHKLVARGKLYGQWKIQQTLADELAG